MLLSSSDEIFIYYTFRWLVIKQAGNPTIERRRCRDETSSWQLAFNISSVKYAHIATLSTNTFFAIFLVFDEIIFLDPVILLELRLVLQKKHEHIKRAALYTPHLSPRYIA